MTEYATAANFVRLYLYGDTRATSGEATGETIYISGMFSETGAGVLVFMFVSSTGSLAVYWLDDLLDSAIDDPTLALPGTQTSGAGSSTSLSSTNSGESAALSADWASAGFVVQKWAFTNWTEVAVRSDADPLQPGLSAATPGDISFIRWIADAPVDLFGS